MIAFTDALLGAVRGLRIWQVFVLLAVLLGSGAATYFGYAEVTAEEGLGLEETTTDHSGAPGEPHQPGVHQRDPHLSGTRGVNLWQRRASGPGVGSLRGNW